MTQKFIWDLIKSDFIEDIYQHKFCPYNADCLDALTYKTFVLFILIVIKLNNLLFGKFFYLFPG
ncbi:hypothetical protein ES708_33227 [subsurface metagenome]